MRVKLIITLLLAVGLQPPQSYTMWPAHGPTWKCLSMNFYLRKLNMVGALAIERSRSRFFACDAHARP